LSKGAELAEAQNIMFIVYILKNYKNQIYVGCTHDIEKRIIRHDSGDGAEFTRRNKDFKLVYKEKYKTLLEARRREKQIKGWRREKKENLIKFGKPVIN
jgi:putative endonuclease